MAKEVVEGTGRQSDNEFPVHGQNEQRKVFGNKICIIRR